jgi:hypothetical protein
VRFFQIKTEFELFFCGNGAPLRRTLACGCPSSRGSGAATAGSPRRRRSCAAPRTPAAPARPRGAPGSRLRALSRDHKPPLTHNNAPECDPASFRRAPPSSPRPPPASGAPSGIRSRSPTAPSSSKSKYKFHERCKFFTFQM